MSFTMFPGHRDKGVEGFRAVYSSTTHVTAISVVLAGKKPWPPPERGPFCLAHWNKGQTLALHNQQVFFYFQAFPGHFCRTRWWREALGTFPSQTVLKWQLQNCSWDQWGKGCCSLVTRKSIFFPPPLTIGAVAQDCTDTSWVQWMAEEAASGSVDHTHTVIYTTIQHTTYIHTYNHSCWKEAGLTPVRTVELVQNSTALEK